MVDPHYISCVNQLINEAKSRIEDGREGDAIWRLIEATTYLVKEKKNRDNLEIVKNSLSHLMTAILADEKNETKN